MSETYSIIFRGDILPGHTLPDVKGRMAQLFKLNDAKVAAIFSGKPVALKKDCDMATAEKFKAVLNKAGAEVEIKSSAPAPARKPAAAPPPPPPPAQAPASAATAPQASIPTEVVPAVPKAPPPAAEPAPSAAADTDGEMSLAPAGSEVLNATERQQQKAARGPDVEVDTSHLSLAPAGALTGQGKAVFKLDGDDEAGADNETPAMTEEEIQAPNFDLAEVGADILDEADKTVFVEKDVDLSSIDLAEAGTDVLRPEERAPEPEVTVQDLQADIAPAGSDMGQIKKDEPPPPPNTDHLSVS